MHKVKGSEVKQNQIYSQRGDTYEAYHGRKRMNVHFGEEEDDTKEPQHGKEHIYFQRLD